MQAKMKVAILTESPDASAMMQHTRETLAEFDVAYIDRAIGGRAQVQQVAAEVEAAGAVVFVVADTSGDALSAAVAGATARPVLAVPLEAPVLSPLEALRASTSGAGAVASLAIGKAGAINAGLLAVAILANGDAGLREKLNTFRAGQTEAVLAATLE